MSERIGVKQELLMLARMQESYAGDFLFDGSNRVLLFILPRNRNCYVGNAGIMRLMHRLELK